MSRFRCIILSIVFMFVFSSKIFIASAQGGYPAQQGQYINDFAHLLSTSDTGLINTALADLKHNKGIDAVVITIGSIHDYSTGDASIESFATHLFNTWRLGNAQTNRGVMILVAVRDRKARIELGAGYDGSYDRRVQAVIDNDMLPSFRENLYSSGILKGVQSVVTVVTTPSGPIDVLFSKIDPSLIGIAVAGALGIMGYGFLYRIQHRCPECGQVTLDIQSNVLVSPTYYSSGEKEVTRTCSNCGYHHTEVVTMARRYRSTSSHRSGGSGGSSGGGHSSGGGATGSW